MFTRTSFHFVSAVSLGVATLVAAAVLVGGFGIASASYPGQDGKIAFEYAGSITLMNPDGSQQTFVERGLRPAWSADGKRFVWVCNPCSNPAWSGQLVVANADGSFPFSLGVNGNDPAWFPDNNTVVFDQNNSLLTAETSNPGVATTLLAAIPGGHQYSQPAVASDGSQLAFTDTVSDTQSTISVLFVHQILLANFDAGYAATGAPINLTNATVGTLDSAADWNPNGSELVFTRSVRVGNSVVELVTEGGGSPSPLPTNSDAWANPKFSPDGNLIVADETLLSSGDIWTMSSLGGGFSPLTHLDLLSVGHPAWQPIPLPVNTPTGFNLEVNPTDQNPAQPVGPTPVEVFFDQVTLAGDTTLTTTNVGPAIPAAYFPPSPPLYYRLATTARFRFIANSNGVAPCMTDPSVTAYSAVLQFDASGSATDVTDPSNFDPATHFICTNPLPSLGTGIFAIVSKPVGPTVTQNPSSTSVNAGGSVSFRAAAVANPVATVQWQLSTDGGATFTNIAGATSTTLTFTAKASDNNSQYRAVFANASGTATTIPATLAVISSPAITTNPSTAVTTAGRAVVFSAAASGNPAPTVQWQVSTDAGVTFSNIAGATSTSLAVTPVVPQPDSLYRAVFTNSVGSATTTAASLIIIVPQVVANPQSLTADGVATATMTVRLIDGSGLAVSAKTVQLSTVSSHVVVNAGSGSPSITNASGQATFTLTDSTPEVVSLAARDVTDSLTLQPQVTVAFVPTGLGNVVTATGAAASTTSTGPVGSIAVAASGGAATDEIVVGQYASNPVSGLESSTGAAFDVLLAQPTNYASLTVTDCALNGGTSVSWWNGTIWQPVTPAPTFNAGPPACARFTLTTNSSPNLSQLTGTVFAATRSLQHSLSLDGATGYADVPNSASLNPLTNWTVEAWFKDEDPNGFNHDFRQIINKGDRNADPEAPYFILIGSNHLLAGVRMAGVDYPIDANLAQLGLDPSTWHHVAVTYRSDLQVLNLWLDGNHISYLAGVPVSKGNTLPVEIGRNGSLTGKYWKGKLDDVRLWNVTRTGTQIASDYLTQLAGPPSANLVANWQFDEASGTTAADFAGNNAATLHGGASFSTDVHP